MAKKAKVGRPKRSRNKGYFFRTGRGWFATAGARKIPLRDEQGMPLRDRRTPVMRVQEAYARYLLTAENPDVVTGLPAAISVADVCRHYLDYCQANDRPNTYSIRRKALVDFCSGFPASVVDRMEKSKAPKSKLFRSERIHAGFGQLSADELRPYHVDQWIAVHPTWKKSKRTWINALRRAMNYAVDARLLSVNPIKGIKVPQDNVRNTYISPELEQAMYASCWKPLANIIRVLIRTGARYGVELLRLTAAHVHESARGMEWRFSADESKNREERVIRITDQQVIAIMRGLMEKYPKGPLFRNRKGKPMTANNLRSSFKQLLTRLRKKGIEIPDNTCPYSCRHTYAKRTLQGYWTGKPTSIENLAKLMGNSPKICFKHYGRWSPDNEHLWDAA